MIVKQTATVALRASCWPSIVNQMKLRRIKNVERAFLKNSAFAVVVCLGTKMMLSGVVHLPH